MMIGLVIVGILILILIDAAWLTLNKSNYEPLLKLMKEPHIPSALVAWTLIFFGCYYLAAKRAVSVEEAMTYGAMFGFFSYGIYNATNMATIDALKPENTLTMAVSDTLWGTVLCAATSGAIFANL
jgi:uncharacterized membrane protein